MHNNRPNIDPRINYSISRAGALDFQIPPRVVVEKPLQIVNTLTSADAERQQSVHISVGEGAQVRFLFIHRTQPGFTDTLQTTQRIEITLEQNASLQLYELEETHTANVVERTTIANLAAGSNIVLSSLTLTGGITNNHVEVNLQGEGAEANLIGMAIADGRQQVANHTVINHIAPRCNSNELYKYVLLEEAVGRFNGLVKVHKNAQHTNSRQTNRNLCASPEARMYAEPQLLIYADDVKCSHGATVGQLDEAALFYMRQRGIPLAEARLLLMSAFLGEVVDTIPLDSLRDRLHLLIEQRLRGKGDKCGSCGICG